MTGEPLGLYAGHALKVVGAAAVNSPVTFFLARSCHRMRCCHRDRLDGSWSLTSMPRHGARASIRPRSTPLTCKPPTRGTHVLNRNGLEVWPAPTKAYPP